MKRSDQHPSKPKSSFFLSKWFLDGVSEGGQVAIGYAARLRWRGVEIPYTSLLLYDPFQGATLRWRLRRLKEPVQEPEGVIQWEDPLFGVKGEWQAAAAPLHARIHESAEGFLDWECYQPRSRVEIRVADGPLIRGWGYAERLTLTLPPWRIPMNELRWGRYSDDQNHLVWIEIKSPESQQWIWFNGQTVPSAIITDDSVSLPGYDITLHLNRCGVLEAEQKILNVVRSLLPWLPGADRFVPRHFLGAAEYKWKSRAILTHGDQVINNGWAIHEWVDFRAATRQPEKPA